jgi:A/G-specific adenine glycosylase
LSIVCIREMSTFMVRFSRKFVAEQGPDHHLAVKLLAWYDVHARILPWRAVSPVRMAPYKVWLSEIMLQQTTVAAVKDYYLKFTNLWPAVEDLAAASLDDVLKAWAGLGYYARARNLHKCAKTVVAEFGGNFPDDMADLIKLPGIGPYTAGAISAIAFDKPYAAVDGNVERVLSRLDAIETPLPVSKSRIKTRAQSLMPEHRAGDFVQALMDLGATLCTPKNPNCTLCPWMIECEGRKRGIAVTLPRKSAKKAIPTRMGHAYTAQSRRGEILLRRRSETGLLGGMMEVPGSDWTGLQPAMQPPFPAQWRKLPGIVEHTFTHFHLEVTVFVAADVDPPSLDPSYRWVPHEDVEGEALPTVMRKILAHARGRRGLHKM